MIGGLPPGNAIAILVWPVCVAAIIVVSVLTDRGGTGVADIPKPEAPTARVEPTDD